MSIYLLLKAIGIYLLLYIIALLFTFLSEKISKKKSFNELKNDAYKIWLRATIIYIIFIISSVCYYLLGIKTD